MMMMMMMMMMMNYDDIGHKPYRPRPYRPRTKSATCRPHRPQPISYRPQAKSISAAGQLSLPSFRRQ